jgi:peptidyl-prolyl cis-trans isomerase B (cyclophilin B)
VAGKDRKKEIARLRYERQQQRRASREAQARKWKVIGVIAAAVVLLGGGSAVAVALTGSNSKSTNAATSPSASAKPSASAAPVVTAKPGECAYQPLTGQAAQSAKNVGTPPAKPVTGTYQMTIDTNLGSIVIALDAKAPCTVNSFDYLAAKKFFNNTICHRLTTQGLKVLQCGDPTGTGSGGPSYGFANENVPPPGNPNSNATYTRGEVAMAHSNQPNSNGSQFFIVYGDSPIPDDYTIFGKVTQGLDIVDKVAKAGTSDGSGDGTPKQKTEIKDLSVTKS